MSAHALLSASGASRWMACPPSARYEQGFPAQESEYADEGTLAHAIATILINYKAFNVPYPKELEVLKMNEMFNEEMWDCVNEFADFVIDIVRNTPGVVMLFLEQRLDMREWIRDGFGTTDVCILTEDTIIIVDYKHGKGVPVFAYENKQMMVYTLGALWQYSLIFDIKKCRMIIFQPRIENISEYEISVEDLMRWGYEVLKPAAELAYEGDGEFQAGEHCRFCRAKALCPTNAKFNMQLAKVAFMPEAITDEQVVKILNNADTIKRYISSLEKHALDEAIKGKKWPGLKLVEGRSTRKYTDEKKIISKLKKEGIAESEIVNKKLTGITDLSKKITKLQFEKFVEPHLIKPVGKPTLVDESDRRPELNSSTSAAEVFNDD